MTRSKFVKSAANWGGALCALYAATAAFAQPADPLAGRKVFKNSVIPLTEPATLSAHSLVVNAAGDQHKTDKMDVVFSLAIPADAKAKLQEKVLKGEVVDPKGLTKDFSPKPEDVQALTAWLKEEGFEITHTTADKTSIYVRGTVAQLEKSLMVTMVRVTKNGLTYNAAKNAPSMPVEVGAGVQAVIGLQPFRQFTKKNRQYNYRVLPPVGSTAISTAAVLNIPPPYLVKDVLKAYNADGLSMTGAGQRIAILIDRLPVEADTEFFWNRNSLAVIAGRVQAINVKNVLLPLPDDGEESMDTQWTSGIASGATIRVYASGSMEFVDHDRSLDRIFDDASNDPGLRQMSISMGLGEQFLSPDGSLSGEVSIENDKFLKFAALGVNIFVSSGDGGSAPNQFGESGGATQVEWMASSPFVIGVGGTSLRLKGTGAVDTENGWAGSGGGISKVFDRPSYQNLTGPGVPLAAKRLVPDISALADPDTGAYVRVNGVDKKIGGTSLSAPVMAGFCALINEARTKAGKPTLPFVNPLIYPLSNVCFRDIADGTYNGDYQTVTGYDMVTGMGVPDVAKLIAQLSNP